MIECPISLPSNQMTSLCRFLIDLHKNCNCHIMILLHCLHHRLVLSVLLGYMHSPQCNKVNQATSPLAQINLIPSCLSITHYTRPPNHSKQKMTIVVACHLYVDAICLVVTREVGLDIVYLFLWWHCDCHMVAVKNCNTFCHDMISANR